LKYLEIFVLPLKTEITEKFHIKYQTKSVFLEIFLLFDFLLDGMYGFILNIY